MNLLARLWTLPREERRLFFEAWACLAAARIALAVLRFERVLGLYRLKNTDEDCPTGSPPNDETVRAIRVALARATPRIPFGATCLPQALAAAQLLGRRRLPVMVLVGGKYNGSVNWEFHAWTKSASVLATPSGAKGHARIAAYTIEQESVDKRGNSLPKK